MKNGKYKANDLTRALCGVDPKPDDAHYIFIIMLRKCDYARR